MPESKHFVCVNCGKPAAALYRTYGPTVLKLTKCKSCKGVVDKFIEYDNVIVMIDAVLISKEAQRHVIYNTDFQSYSKLFIVQTLLETYGVWRNDSLLNIGINSFCKIKTTATVNTTYLHIPLESPLPASLQAWCGGWRHDEPPPPDQQHHFIWEGDFYMQFISTLAGTLAFIFTIHLLMKLARPLFLSKREVPFPRLLRGFSLANSSVALTLPMLVWGAPDTRPETRAGHYALVFVYHALVSHSALSVLYEAPTLVTLLALVLSNIAKYTTTFYTTPFLRSLFVGGAAAGAATCCVQGSWLDSQ